MLKRFPIAWICLSVLFVFAAPSFGEEKIVMKVYLNTEDRGEYFVVMTPEKGVLIRRDDLARMGFVSIPEGSDHGDGAGYVLLDQSTAWARAEIDERELIVRLTADPKHLRKNIIDASSKRPLSTGETAASSAFLNYSLGYSTDDSFGFTAFTALAEAGLTIDDYLFMSNFSYVEEEGADEKFTRLLTSVTRDDIAAQRRYILGDVFAYSGVLGGGSYLGGFSVSRNFGITPYFIKTSGLDLSGVLTTPSDVEVYVNGYPVRTERMSPGEFELQNIYNATGEGGATVKIKDAYGRTEEFTVPFYISSAVLKPGLSEYSYNIGLKRDNIGLESSSYNGPAISLFHNYGFTREFTAGIRAEADKDLVNFGPSAALLAGRYGEAQASAAFSSSDGSSGAAGTLSYTYSGRTMSAFASVSAFTKDYSNFAIPVHTNRTKLNSALSIGYNLERFGSMSGAVSRLDAYTGSGITRYSATYNKTVFRNVALHILASRTTADNTVNEVFAGLNFLLGAETSGGVSYRTQAAEPTETAFIQNAQPTGTGFGYRALAERVGGELGGNMNVQYNGRHGVYSADYRRVAGADSYDVSTAGGIAYIDGSVHFSRPITDAFALVKVGDAKGVNVYYTNQEAGVTDGEGELLVPNLISYQDNQISIDDKDLPVNYSIDEVSKTVIPLNRRGVIVRFDANRLQGFGGRLFVNGNGARSPAEYGRVTVAVGGKEMESVIGKWGEFYMENLPAGRFPAEVFFKGKRCSFELAIPESDNNIVDIGEVTCEMD